MPNSPSPPPSADSLRSYLADALPHSNLTVKPVDAEHQPILLLQTTHVMAGFAFSNGNMNASYDFLYDRFKTYFKEQRGAWDALDLAFVFCVQPGVANLDQFCSSVETDVYFCRKFVVPLLPPLSSSLARLPFLPLTPLHGKALRPASAQTFLQQCGVPAALAKNIVVQQTRGPEGIVEDCISGEFGEPNGPKAVANSQAAQVDSKIEPVRLDSVTIKNFRAYRKEQTFKLGADATVLYGPNGFGKTSFFDAIDFAVTGGIGRLDSISDGHFAKTAQHLDTGAEDSVVSLFFQSNGSARKISRSVKSRKHPLLDNRAADRKTILAELVGREIQAADRVENFSNLFRATHLFNQEQQELTKNFQNDCCLPADIVSRMLAFQDYTNAVKKAARVCEVLESIISTSNRDITELSEQIADETRQLDRLRQTTKANTSSDVLATEFGAFRSRLEAAGFEAATLTPEVTVLRGLRATIEARQGESKIRTERLAELAKEVATLPKMRSDISSLQQQVRQTEEALTSSDEIRVATESMLQRAEQALSETNNKVNSAQARCLLLEWVRTTTPEYRLILEKQRTLNDEVSNLAKTVSQCRATEEKAAADLRARESEAAQVTENLRVKRIELAAVQNLLQLKTSWETNRSRLASVIESEAALPKTFESLQSEERKFTPQLTALTADERRLAQQIAAVDKGQSELKSLLSQIQGHIRTGTCPLCGDEHGSKDELLRRIERQVATDAASVARTELRIIRENGQNLRESIGRNQQQQQTVKAQIAALANERAMLEAQIGDFVGSAAEVGIVVDPSLLADQIQSRLNRVEAEIKELTESAQTTGAATDSARTALAIAKTTVVAQSREEATRREALTRINQDALRLQSDPRFLEIPLNIESEQLARDQQIAAEQLAGFKTEVTNTQNEITQKKAEISTLREQSAALKGQLQALRPQLSNLQRKLTQITARLEESRFPPEASEDMLLSVIAEESRRQAQLVALRDSASNLEVAVDAMTTAAALTTLQQNVRSKEKSVAGAIRNRDQHQPWLAYFAKLSQLVSAQQNDAIASFTNEYGPRTSIIQRRLRSVYGFDDIEIQSQDSTIRVRVKRHGEELRPIDYFSQSQQQTLLLGLFLTACISQTWSGFAPVFMDDPVTHFDDLNTYAFLDLIVGLLDSDFGKRQFIISTCDEKLLQLAQQKFRHLGDRALFYRFDAIGPEGPVVEAISQS